MHTKLVLVDTNLDVVRAWRAAFADCDTVRVVHGSIVEQPTSAWVTPTNACGTMRGGVDAAVRASLGAQAQARVRRQIRASFGDCLPVGYAALVETGHYRPTYLISAPTRFAPVDDATRVTFAAVAFGAALQAVSAFNRVSGGAIRSVAAPGIGAGSGRITPAICADSMRAAYAVWCRGERPNFYAMRSAVEHELTRLGLDRRPWARAAAPRLTSERPIRCRP